MGRQVTKLTARFVETVREPGRYGDGAGLYLVVGKGGGKSWLFIYRFGAKQREMGLGPQAAVSLKDARDAASEARKLLVRGVDPIEDRAEQHRLSAAAKAAEDREANTASFGKFATDLLNGYTETDSRGRERKVPGLKEGFRNAKHAMQWETTLRDYASSLWDLKLDEIETDDVLGCIAPIWTKKNETARRVRGRIETVLAAAIARRLRPGPNPATLKGNLEALLPRVSKLQRGHHPALPWTEVPDFWQKLSALNSVSARALAFTILTAARSGETRGATWGEIDQEGKTWTVPAARMKAGREHVIPLSDQALGIIDEVAQLRQSDDPSELVFPSIRARTLLSDMALSMCARGIREGITVHGFRSSFRDWAGDNTTFPRELAEQALAHTVGGVEGAYRRGTALERRRQMMTSWASFVTGTEVSATILPLTLKSS
ncbi:hypothetical protein ASE36_18910 [Rhizobium sp. Root274]|uniref:tyrosine-type recombinase/integrase n=1 Tax=unclassified Rhizobium TaxID=2613769 RepID=UPI000712BA51|nr:MULTISPECIES: site-specific integrase [unclassified Rhizobium]KQW27654.1 hypothetical protein ASC71_18950 [Rhizobium sp. Root1240]KRD27890.1 hypothetical protein ASE36_18910 [Rhizobium sp. Root274]